MFNITSNILGAMNTIANMQTAKTTQEQAEMAAKDRTKQEEFRNQQLSAITSTGEAQLSTLNEINSKIQKPNKPNKQKDRQQRGFQTGESGTSRFNVGMTPADFAQQRVINQVAQELNNNRRANTYFDFVRKGAPTYYFDENNDPVFLDTKTGEEIKKPTGGNK